MPISRALQTLARQYLGPDTPVRNCPFCGSDDLHLNKVNRSDGDWYCVVCSRCRTMGPQGRDHTGCLALWQGVVLEMGGILMYHKRRVIRVRRPHGSRAG